MYFIKVELIKIISMIKYFFSQQGMQGKYFLAHKSLHVQTLLVVKVVRQSCFRKEALRIFAYFLIFFTSKRIPCFNLYMFPFIIRQSILSQANGNRLCVNYGSCSTDLFFLVLLELLRLLSNMSLHFDGLHQQTFKV